MTDISDLPAADGPRARDLGMDLDGQPGKWNAITDVPGLQVGYATIIEDSPVVARTGVTVILPRGREAAARPCAAGVSVLNGNGELTGRAWIDEAGQLQTPIGITNSHAVGAVHCGIDRWMARHHPEAAAQWMLPVVGETWDGYLNSINADTVSPEHAEAALDAAAGGRVAEGNVGGGTGMNCYGFKGGTGTASRVVTSGDREWTVGVLVQANFGARRELRVNGRPLGRMSAAPSPMESTNWFQEETASARRAVAGAGSVIVIVATDAPLLPIQCQALARRVPLGLARTGTTGSHFSGDIFLAFSTANEGRLHSRMGTPAGTIDTVEHLAWGGIDPFYAAVVEATEESVLNALVAARDLAGRDGHASFALPHEEIRRAFAS
ncbi:L-aminopeptidase/D-esterase-like protein [Brevibacterium sanguinis]|uniref:L-aminopeptidase/D-esterase-like protein n=2 Tax=Brevibacterium TaxID=1696 RepID=A0A366IKD7_9MICO|nr:MULTISPECIES: P1 family peptidase [Brevibacterium]RBP64955.1 L-aminopeptidase/D-esterase-like protein [Brevibacterium sanguinis]RBP71218.1 L-aminopeptidase/D-esterase-like protein [Brevibacterium celere]